jgi:hypothetical protein
MPFTARLEIIGHARRPFVGTVLGRGFDSRRRDDNYATVVTVSRRIIVDVSTHEIFIILKHRHNLVSGISINIQQQNNKSSCSLSCIASHIWDAKNADQCQQIKTAET